MAPSDRTLAATAAFTGIAMFALIRDIAARSGSSSPASCSSSSRVTLRYSCTSATWLSFRRLVALRNVARLLRVRVCDRVVARDVQRDGGVDRSRDVRIDQRHR